MDDHPLERAPVVVETTAAGVTFFEDRAEVVRAATFRIPAGPSRVHARGLTLLVDDRSVTCRCRGADVVFVRARRTVEDVTEASAEEIVALEAEVETLRTRLGALDRALGNVGAEGRRASTMFEQWVAAAVAVPSRAEAAVEELDRAWRAIDQRLVEGLDAYGRLRTEREDTHAELARASARLERARARKPRYEALVEIELVAPVETEVALELVYRTPCALWRPEHRARLSRDGEGKGVITITTYATVWQRTGEVWRNVQCRFSTARPTRDATAPSLRDDVLVSRKKTDAERARIVVEARDQAITAAGVAGGTRDVDEMPGVEDGGEARWLAGRSPATIESDGRPVRVEVSQREVPCKVERVCFPELGPAVHLRATATLPGPAPLLAGPVTLGRETEIVGRGVVKFVGPGEPFELGFGVDDGLRVRRRVVEKRKTTQVTGTQHVTRQVRLFVSNLGGEPRALSVVERVPVSEVEDVQVEIEKAARMRHDARDGFVTFDVEVAPRATRDLVLDYRIEASSKVVLPASLP